MAGLIKFGFALGQLSYMAPNLDPIQDFLDTPEQRRPEKPVKLGERSFRFDRVCFSYDGKKEVLHDVSFTARTGQITAIVGPSGSGKSTIAKLMAGFWDATGGTVSFGGQDIQNIPFDQLMGEISYVAQDNFLFDRSIRENIRMGDPGATDAEVEAAARPPTAMTLSGILEQGYEHPGPETPGTGSPAESASASPSPGPCSKRRPSSFWTRQPPSLTPRARRRSNRPSPVWYGARP